MVENNVDDVMEYGICVYFMYISRYFTVSSLVHTYLMFSPFFFLRLFLLLLFVIIDTPTSPP